MNDLHYYYSEIVAKEKKEKRTLKRASQHWKGLADKRKTKITELQQSKNKLADELSAVAKVTLEMELKLIMNKATISETKVELKCVG